MASDGDPRVLLAMNIVLSSIFASVVVWGLSYLDLAALTLENVAGLAIVVFAATYLLVLR
ncbi:MULTISPECIES: hypothetical protein [Halobaculum]|uniref:DUF8107 domain-containing protein n=2 Tax=Halobaculum TaxID=43927 RepID=A0A8T8W9X1_9EURY|nr:MULTISPECIES: hypothetical protein [Halobaculum]QZP36553.1 hypothetical protein K6T50_09510 [Halobaculum magnesiiphilum]QZY01530.1 hypothetical protein K6T36_09285 [Halobaculum roseum]